MRYYREKEKGGPNPLLQDNNLTSNIPGKFSQDPNFKRLDIVVEELVSKSPNKKLRNIWENRTW
jgi:hypothetical protein